jgi:hypothetical protein
MTNKHRLSKGQDIGVYGPTWQNGMDPRLPKGPKQDASGFRKWWHIASDRMILDCLELRHNSLGSRTWWLGACTK